MSRESSSGSIFTLIATIFIVIILASIIKCDETPCDCTCGQGPQVRETLKDIFSKK